MGRLEIGRVDEAQNAGLGVDREFRRVEAAGDSVSDIGPDRIIAGGDDRRGQLIFGDRDGSRGAAAVGGDRRAFVDVGDRDADRLGDGNFAVGGADDDVVHAVGAGIAGRLEIGRAVKAQDAGDAVDGQLAGIGAADDGVNERIAFGIERGDGDGRTVLNDRQGGRRCEGRSLVDVSDGDGERLGDALAGGARRHLDVVDIVRP